MEDYKFDNTPEGELSGFDNVNNDNSSEQNSEYTVTPEDNFYTKRKEDIIQDDISKEQPVYTENVRDNFSYTNPQTDVVIQPPYQPPKKQRKPKSKNNNIGVIIAACLLSAILGLTGGILGGIAANLNKTDKASSLSDSNTNDVTSNVTINVEETTQSVVEAVAKKVTPSVIGIRTTTSVLNFFGGSSETSGEGSGVIYSKDGYIITNYHVIKNAISNSQGSKIEVFLEDKSSQAYKASVVGYHISADLAVIKIDAKNLIPAEFADSDKLKVGQYVVTVGNPGGLEFMDSVTYGIISGLNRVVSTDSDIELIQTDAAINPGNSGGALVNAQGKLVGINSSKIVAEEFENMGFAIPSNTVEKICKKIIEKENSPEPYVGITISETYTPKVLEYYNFPVGAVVLSVAENSPASSAGIRKGDIITNFGDTEITKYQVLEQAIKDSTPNSTVTVKIYRSGKYYSTKMTIGSNNSIN